MSTAAHPLPLNQAITLAADTLEALQEIPSVADIAEQAGVTRQYLYRLANREIERRQKEKGEGRQDASPETRTSPDRSNGTLPQDSPEPRAEAQKEGKQVA